MATIDAPGGSYTPGCTAVDKTFTNFAYNIGSPQYSGSTSYLGWGGLSWATVTSPTGSGNTPGDTEVVFQPGGSFWEASTDGGYAYDSVTFTYTVQSAGVMNQASLVSLYWYSGYTAQSDGYADVQLLICPGVTTFTAGCAGEQVMTNAGSVSFSPTAVLGIQDTVYFYASSAAGYYSDAYIQAIYTDFYDTPEPSTFSLLAAGLGAAAWMRRRQRISK
jgi:hypothetical protein